MEVYLGVLVKLVGSDVVDGEDKLDIVLLGLLYELLDLFGPVLVEKRLADLIDELYARCTVPGSSR
jgi:hypothetical protein